MGLTLKLATKNNGYGLLPVDPSSPARQEAQTYGVGSYH